MVIGGVPGTRGTMDDTRISWGDEQKRYTQFLPAERWTSAASGMIYGFYSYGWR